MMLSLLLLLLLLQTADGDLTAHRVVLASASPTLDRLFRLGRPSDASGTTAQLDLREFGRETVADVVNFAYAGELELTSRNVGPVTACACELDFQSVVDICRSYLLDQVDTTIQAHANSKLLLKLCVSLDLNGGRQPQQT